MLSSISRGIVDLRSSAKESVSSFQSDQTKHEGFRIEWLKSVVSILSGKGVERTVDYCSSLSFATCLSFAIVAFRCESVTEFQKSQNEERRHVRNRDRERAREKHRLGQRESRREEEL